MNPSHDSAEIRHAFAEYDRQATISNFKVACIIGMVLMPAGFILDSAVYPGVAVKFLKLRFACSALIAIFLASLLTQVGLKYHRQLGVILFLLPASFISWMIYVKDGAVSPYYAGLNLVLLVLSLVLHWSFWESLTVTVLVLIEYSVAVFCHGPISKAEAGVFINNLYFLVLTAIIAITGSYFFSKTRYREFAFRFQLDASKRELESTNNKLFDQNIALEKANREIKEAEMQLVQSEKMASLGRFSAGLMHDVLNPLNYSRTGLFVLKKKTRKLPPDLGAETEAVLTDIEDGLARVNDIVSGLRTFTHPGEQASEEIELAEILDVSTRWISSEIRDKNIAVKLALAPGQKVWAGRNHLTTVIVNLLENAIDALAEKKFANGEKPQIEVAGRTEGDRTKIIFRDNGPGIAPENLAKVFDPFFTTKEVGKGTGLGLSICFGIVRGCGGTLAAASEPGKFCEFTVDLPANQAAAAAAKIALQHAEPTRL